MLLQLDQINKNFKDFSISDVSFGADENQILALLGESGSGKSTILRMIAGFESPDNGKIELNGVVLSDANNYVAAEKRGVGMVFQDHALFPHLSVAENILFGIKGLSKEEQKNRLSEMLSLVQLDGYNDRMPNQLSGGEKQRVAIARALATKPKLLLLDEPFSNLDALLREQMRKELRRIIKQANTTAIFVTHDISDVYYTADQVMVIKDGKKLQLGSLKEVYDQPADLYVGSLFGPLNALKGTIKDGQFLSSFGKFDCDRSLKEDHVFVRPENIHLDGGDLKGKINYIQFIGDKYELGITSKTETIRCFVNKADSYELGMDITFHIHL